MDMPTIDVDLGPEKIEDDKQEGPLLHCGLCDTEIIHKLAQMFLPGLASACVDNTSGDLFKTPGSVAVDLRKEMIEFLVQRSESFVAESVILEGGPDGEVSYHPYDIISNLVDDFASSKRNLFSRVSGWVLSERREDNIDDFVQEMEMNGFWTHERRETIAETLLKNVDFANSYHCNMSFSSAEDLADHIDNCNFRSMICENLGCNSRFCASHLNDHDSTCPFKIISCEQKCPANIMRREMDRHCITVCPMKLVNCPFYAIGCRSAVAQCMIEKHRSDDINSHLWYFLKGNYKEASGDDLNRRVEQIVQASSGSRLVEARDVRSLSIIVKNIEAKLGPFEMTVVEKTNSDDKNDEGEDGETNMNSSDRSINASDVTNSSDKIEVSDTKNTTDADNVVQNEDSKSTPSEDGKSTPNEDGKSTPIKNEDGKSTPTKNEDSNSTPTENEDSKSTPTKDEDSKSTPTENEGHEERTQTSNVTNVSDKAEIDLNEENKDVATSESKIEAKEESTQTHEEKLSNEEVSPKNKDNSESKQI